MRVLPALLCALVLATGLAGCGSSNDGTREEMDTGTSIASRLDPHDPGCELLSVARLAGHACPSCR